MKLDEGLLEFLSGPVLLMASAADSRRRPAIARGMGARGTDEGAVEVAFSSWQWPDVVSNVGASGRLALTACRANDYVTYQLKGAAALREARAEDLAHARRYWEALTEVLLQNHVPPHIMN